MPEECKSRFGVNCLKQTLFKKECLIFFLSFRLPAIQYIIRRKIISKAGTKHTLKCPKQIPFFLRPFFEKEKGHQTSSVRLIFLLPVILVGVRPLRVVFLGDPVLDRVQPLPQFRPVEPDLRVEGRAGEVGPLRHLTGGIYGFFFLLKTDVSNMARLSRNKRIRKGKKWKIGLLFAYTR